MKMNSDDSLALEELKDFLKATKGKRTRKGNKILTKKKKKNLENFNAFITGKTPTNESTYKIAKLTHLGTLKD